MEINSADVIPDAIDPASVVVDAPSANQPIAPHEHPELQAKWASAGPIDRIKMMLPWLADNGTSAIYTETPVRPAMKMGLTAAGAIGGEALAGPPGAFVGAGGGNAAAQWIDNKIMGDNKPIDKGEVAASAILGPMAGGSLGGATAKKQAMAALKFGTQSVLSKTADTAIDELRMPTAGEAAIAFGGGAIAAPISALIDSGSTTAALSSKKALMEVRDQTLKDARQAGYVIPSSKVNPSTANNVAESFAGKAATAQEAALKNQEVTNALARKAIGLAPDDAITPAAIENVRSEAGKAYEAVAQISPEAAQTLEMLKQARYNKNLQQTWYQRSGNPEALNAANAQQAAADTLENKLEGLSAHNPDLMENLKAARVQIAKTYQVENALNAATGNVSAADIAKAFGPKTPLTDELATIGRFQQAFPAFAREAEKVPSAGVGKTKAFGSIILSGAGTHMLGPVGAVAGAALPFADTLARKAVLSRAWQKSSLGSPNYGTASPEAMANLARFMTQGAANQVSPANVQQFMPQGTP